MFTPFEVHETTISVGGVQWHLQPRPFWETEFYLDQHEEDQRLSKYALLIKGATLGANYFELNPGQARLTLKRLSPVQLIEFSGKLDKLCALYSSPKIKLDLPNPVPEPHWKRALTAADKLAPEHQNTIATMMKAAKEELQNDGLREARVERNYQVLLRGLEKGESPQPSSSEDESPTDLYPMTFSQTEDQPVVKEKPPRKFVLGDIHVSLFTAISTNSFLFHGSWGENQIVLRYVGRRELVALNLLYPKRVERDRILCILSIAALNGQWCISSTAKLSPEASAFVDTWRGADVDQFMPIVLKMREYAQSLLPYTEALPFTKLLRDFWDANKSRPMWWSEELSGIPNISSIPPLEHIDQFIQECHTEEAEVQKLHDDERVALQVSGISGDLAQSLQNRISDTFEARAQHINFMLFNEIPARLQKDPNEINVPGENTQEDMVAFIENLHKGQADYHDLMLALLRKRKESMEQLHPLPQHPVPPPPSTREEVFEGGSHYASSAEIQQLQKVARDRRIAQDKEIYEFSTDVMANIAKQRKRALLIEGRDPYHEQDHGVELGPAKVITRKKNF